MLERHGLLTVAAFGIVAGSLWFVVAVAFRHTSYPRWMAAFTPLTFVVLFGLAARLVPPLALVIAPAALNLSHLAFFAISTVTLWNTGGRN